MTAESTMPMRGWRFPWRLQFSLRLLLLALTAFAIGFPIWYRWPYEEVEVSYSAPGGAEVGRRIITWQRQWGGERLKHGFETWSVKGSTVFSVMYRRGRKHGPVMGRGAGGQLVVVGQHVDNMREGVWTGSSDTLVRTATWHRDKLEGPYEIEAPSGGKLFHLLFADGHLTHFDGQPARNRLFDLMEDGVLDEMTAAELQKSTMMGFVEQPLKDCALYLQEQHGISMMVDHLRVPMADLPITADYKGIDLCSALTLLTAPHDLGCDYRYGCVWITTAKDTEDWRDPTGVSQITPAKNTSLARVWNGSDPIRFGIVNTPLVSILARIAQEYAIEIDTTDIEPTGTDRNAFLINATTKDLSLRHLLGLVLYQAGCRCKLEGDKLVILRPESP